MPSPAHTRQRGFALLITVTLLAFLVLLLVSLATFTRVETQVALNAGQQTLARQNALLALNVALGQLQKETGPDQRVTARAEILDSNPATETADGVAPGSRLWTGVWKTYHPGAADQKLDTGANLRDWSLHQEKPVWLVSTPPGMTPDPATALPGGTPTAVLARQVGSVPEDVVVPLVPLSADMPGLAGTTRVGSFAYWVSDEGLKARADLVDPTYNASGDELNRLHLSTSQALPMQRILPLRSGVSDFRDTPAADLRKLLSPQALPLLPTLAPGLTPKTYAPDITTTSMGVLADVRHGGLKVDLTAAFEDSGTYAQFKKLLSGYSAGVTTDGSNSNQVYAADGIPLGTAADLAATGPLWQSLYYYYNSYKPASGTPRAPSVPGNPSATAAVPGLDQTQPLPYPLKVRAYNTQGPVSGDKSFLSGFMPVIIAYRVDVALASHLEGGVWKLQLQYYPQLVLYNPYATRLTASGQGIRLVKTLSAFNHDTLSIKLGSSSTLFVHVQNARNSSGVNGRFVLGNANGSLPSLEPGETRAFALKADAPKTSIRDASSFDTVLQSASDPAVSADWCQSVDVAEITTNAATGKGTLKVFDEDTDKATVVPKTSTSPFDLVGGALPALQLNLQTVSANPKPNGTFVVSYMDEYLKADTLNWPLSEETRFSVGPGPGNDLKMSKTSWSGDISALNGNPRRVLGFFARLKGLKPSSAGSAASSSGAIYANGASAIPLFIGNAAPFNLFEDESSTQWQEIYLPAFGDPYLSSDTAISTTASGEVPWGDLPAGEGMGAGATVERHILRDVPTQPLVSLGQFMHMPAYRFTKRSSSSLTDYVSLAHGSMFTGGSIVPPVMDPAATSVSFDWDAASTATGFIGKRLYLDDSFLANEALFDRFFFSTVPPATLPGASPSFWTAFNGANTGARLSDATKPLLNARLQPLFRDGTPPRLADLRDLEQASGNLMLNGAFNINSTSVPAWKALLSSLSGNKLDLWSATGRALASLDGSGADKNPIPRFWSGSSTGTANGPWDGLRVLTDAEIAELAGRIVQQVKTRGPFLSMADFLNRHLGPDSALTRAGALQAAIDTTTPDINQAAKNLGVPVDASGGKPVIVPADLFDAAGRPLNTAVGMPGYLMQQDLVQAFSPVMTARSDTFVVRTYGEVINPVTGATGAKAWLEAVVQRTPDYIDQTDPALAAHKGNATPAYDDAGAALLDTDNLHFGRRYKIVRFRWLSPDDL